MKGRLPSIFLPAVIFAALIATSSCGRFIRFPGLETATSVPAAPPTDEKPTATITPDPILGLPPEAILHIETQSQIAGIGSYCWPGVAGQFSACADAIGIPTAQEPLQAGTTLTATLELPLEDPPTEVQQRVALVTEADEMEETARGLRWWPPKPGDSIPLPAETSPEIHLSLDPGLYVISIFARWEGLGDVIYGFLVEVAPEEARFSFLSTYAGSIHRRGQQTAKRTVGPAGDKSPVRLD